LITRPTAIAAGIKHIHRVSEAQAKPPTILTLTPLISVSAAAVSMPRKRRGASPLAPESVALGNQPRALGSRGQDVKCLSQRTFSHAATCQLGWSVIRLQSHIKIVYFQYVSVRWQVAPPASNLWKKTLQTAGSLGSTAVTLLHRYYEPNRHPLAFDRL